VFCGGRPWGARETGVPRPSSRRRGGGTQRRSGDPKQGRSRRQPRPGRRAKTRRITSAPGKAVGVSETGGSGRSSAEEGDNTTRSEPRTRGPWWSQRRPEAGWSEKPTRDGRRAKERRRRYQTEKAGGGMQTWCFTPVALSGRVGLIDRRHGLKPDWGELNVRNFRGGAGNVRDGRTRNPRHISKEWRAETLDLRLRAPVLYSTIL
jgi:hypothetical protein